MTQGGTPRKVTLKDVADRAEVSITTASFVLNRRDEMRIGIATQERVRRAARELDYRPNMVAKSLKTQRTETLALLSDYVATDGFAGGIITGSLAAAVSAGHMLFIGEFAADRALEEKLVDDFLARQVDGFIYASSYAQTVTITPRLRSQNVVLANCLPAEPGVSSVTADSSRGGHDLATLLVESGHVDDIYLVGEVPPHVVAGVDRLQGLIRGLGENDASLAGEIECKWWPESANEAMTTFLREGGKPGVLVCLNDRIAMGAYEALARAGLAVPEDVSVVSFDDSPLASWLDPPLTSVAIPHEEIGRRAVELLLDPPDEPRALRVDMPIRHRDSLIPVS